MYHGDKSNAKILSPEAFCFILDPESEERVEFQLMPDQIAESKSAIYNEIPILGRSLPLLGYGSSSARAIGLTLSFVALNSKQSGGKYTTDWVKKQVRWLEARVYPRYLDAYTFPPPKVWVVVGSVIGMQAVMTNCTTQWLGPWDAADEQMANPMRASVDCQFQEIGKNDDEMNHPHGFADAISGKNQWGPAEGNTGGAYVNIPLAL